MADLTTAVGELLKKQIQEEQKKEAQKRRELRVSAMS